jgi:hypothetical protein
MCPDIAEQNAVQRQCAFEFQNTFMCVHCTIYIYTWKSSGKMASRKCIVHFVITTVSSSNADDAFQFGTHTKI